MMIVSPTPVFRWTDNNGNPAVGWMVETYIAGSSTLVDTYTDATGTAENTNPIILDARGEANIWLDPAISYKYVIKNSLGVVQDTIDQIQAGSGGSGGLTRVYYNDSSSIAYSGLGTVATPLSSAVKLSAQPNNALQVRADGLYAMAIGGGGSVAWGSITGNISAQTDLINKFGEYLPLTFGTDQTLLYSGFSTFEFKALGEFRATSLINNYSVQLRPPSLSVFFAKSPTEHGNLKADAVTAVRTWTLPDASGTIALASQIPSLSGYATEAWVSAGFQPLNANLTGLSALSGSSGLIRRTGSTYVYDNAVYITASALADYIKKDGTTTTTALIPFANGASFGTITDLYGGNIVLTGGGWIRADSDAGVTQLLGGRNPTNARFIASSSQASIAGSGLSINNVNTDSSAIRIPNESWIRPQTAGQGIYLTNGTDPTVSNSTLHLTTGYTALFCGTGSSARARLELGALSALLVSTDASGAYRGAVELGDGSFQISTSYGSGARVQGLTDNLTIQSGSSGTSDISYNAFRYHKWDTGISGSTAKYQFNGSMAVAQGASFGDAPSGLAIQLTGASKWIGSGTSPISGGAALLLDSNYWILRSNTGNTINSTTNDLNYAVNGGSHIFSGGVIASNGISITGTNADSSAIRIPDGSWIRPQTAGGNLLVSSGTGVVGGSHAYLLVGGARWSLGSRSNTTVNSLLYTGSTGILLFEKGGATRLTLDENELLIYTNTQVSLSTPNTYIGGAVTVAGDYTSAVGSISLTNGTLTCRNLITINGSTPRIDFAGVSYIERVLTDFRYGTSGNHLWDNGIASSTAKYQFNGSAHFASTVRIGSIPAGTQVGLVGYDSNGNLIQGSAGSGFVTISGHNDLTTPWSIGDASTWNASSAGIQIDPVGSYGLYLKGNAIIEQAVSQALTLYRPVASGDICLNFDAWDALGVQSTYAQVCGVVVSNTAQSVGGGLDFEVAIAGVLTPLLQLRQAGSTLTGALSVTGALSGSNAGFSSALSGLADNQTLSVKYTGATVKSEMAKFFAPNAINDPTGMENHKIWLGRSFADFDAGYIGYSLVGNNSVDNHLDFGVYNNDHILRLRADARAEFKGYVTMAQRLRIGGGADDLTNALQVNGSTLLGGSLTATPPASITPASNGQMTFELTSNTQLKIKVRGSDGIVREASLTLA